MTPNPLEIEVAGKAREDKQRPLRRGAASPIPLLGNMFGSVDSFA
jgi:hypothetical protein